MKAPFVRSPYNYDVDKVSQETGLRCEDESLADQSQRDDADINVIFARYQKTGILPQSVVPPMEGDFTGITDFQSALNAVLDAEERFMSLPAKVRARFENDPQQLLEFVGNSANYDEALSLGIAMPRPAEPAAPAPAPAAPST